MSRMGNYFKANPNASHTHVVGTSGTSSGGGVTTTGVTMTSSMFPQQYTSNPTAQTIPPINFPPPSSLLDGEVTQIKGKMYRYSAVKEEWHEVIDAENEVKSPPAPIKLDASSMLLALIEFKTFLEDIEGLPQETAEVIDDVVWGLDETILALNKLF